MKGCLLLLLLLDLSVCAQQGHGPGGDLRKLLKQKLPALLGLLLGSCTNVVAVQVCSLRLGSSACLFKLMSSETGILP